MFGKFNISSYLCPMFKTKTLYTGVPTLGDNEIRRIVSLTVYYCKHVFGINGRRPDLGISIRTQKRGPWHYGVYDSNTNKIVINKNVCTNIKQLVMTTIHEYTHYMQPVVSHYNNLLEEYGYDKHPMEVEAREKESHYYKHCWEYIKQYI